MDAWGLLVLAILTAPVFAVYVFCDRYFDISRNGITLRFWNRAYNIPLEDVRMLEADKSYTLVVKGRWSMRDVAVLMIFGLMLNGDRQLLSRRPPRHRTRNENRIMIWRYLFEVQDVAAPSGAAHL